MDRWMDDWVNGWIDGMHLQSYYRAWDTLGSSYYREVYFCTTRVRIKLKLQMICSVLLLISNVPILPRSLCRCLDTRVYANENIPRHLPPGPTLLPTVDHVYVAHQAMRSLPNLAFSDHSDRFVRFRSSHAHHIFWSTWRTGARGTKLWAQLVLGFGLNCVVLSETFGFQTRLRSSGLPRYECASLFFEIYSIVWSLGRIFLIAFLVWWLPSFPVWKP